MRLVGLWETGHFVQEQLTEEAMALKEEGSCKDEQDRGTRINSASDLPVNCLRCLSEKL